MQPEEVSIQASAPNNACVPPELSNASRRLPQGVPTLRIPDDRGAFHALAERDDPWARTDARLRRMRRQQTSALVSFTGNPVGWILFIVLWLGMIVLLGSGAFPPVLVYAMFIALGLAWVWLGIAKANRRMADNTLDLAQQWAGPALRRGLCPVCEYTLHGVAEQADGCVVCPECGSAWRRARLGRRAAEPALKPTSIWTAIIDPVELNTLRLIDDQGRRRPAEGLRSVMSSASAPPQRAPALERAVRTLRGRFLWLRIAIAALLFAPAAGAVALLGMAIVPGPVRLSALAAPLFFLWLAIVIVRSDLGVSAAARIRGLLGAAFCPVCGCDLEGEAPDDRGMISCPDCDARWLRSR